MEFWLIVWVVLPLMIVQTVGWCLLAKRLGYEMFVGVFMIVPVVGFILFLYWAFNESPNERKLHGFERRYKLEPAPVSVDPNAAGEDAQEFLATLGQTES